MDEDDERPPRDFPAERPYGDFAVIRSAGTLRYWRGRPWRWDGHDWQPVPPATDQ
jgi:hypothetical protein